MTDHPIVAAVTSISLGQGRGPTGWAWYVDERSWSTGGESYGTHQQGYLQAILDLLRQSSQEDCALFVVCSNQAVIETIAGRLSRWDKSGWLGPKDTRQHGDLVYRIFTELDQAGRFDRLMFADPKSFAKHPLRPAVIAQARDTARRFDAHTGDGQPTLRYAPGFRPTS